VELARTRSRIALPPAWLGALLGGLALALALAVYPLAARSGYPLADITFVLSEPLAALVGGLVLARRPTNPVGWCIVGHAFCFTLGEFTRQYALYGLVTNPGSLPLARLAAWPPYWLWGPGILFGFTLLPLYFPDGRLVSPRWRLAVAATVLSSLATTTIMALQNNDSEVPGVVNPLGITDMHLQDAGFGRLAGIAWIASVIIAALSLVVRFRRARGDERQQLKWFVYAVLLLVATIFVPEVSPLIDGIVLFLVLNALWLSIAVAVLKYRLYDIDIIINRTLVYGALTACVVGLYVVVVVGIGVLLRNEDNMLPALAATVLIAIVFQPLRARLQRGVNRLLYGERDEPYALLTRLGRNLAATLAPDAALAVIVETLATALKLPYAAILIQQGDAFVLGAEFPATPSADDRSHTSRALLDLPLVYQGESVGLLRVAPRRPDEAFTAADRRLLDDLARQIGVVVSAARLTVDLRRSRERLVSAREEERRRIRRDLHDGLGPTLAAQTLKLGSARYFLSRDPAIAERLLDELERDIDGALQDVRRLVYDLRPPALDQLGLVGALDLLAAQYGHGGEPDAGGEAPRPDLHIRVAVMGIDGRPELPPLPAAVEVAAYRIAQEALANVVRHAGARHALVRVEHYGPESTAASPLRLRAVLALTIQDDGRGLPAERRIGVGLHSMRERAEELSGTCTVEAGEQGGTLVRAYLPLEESHETRRQAP
jgi:signal transduction histidine kinase